MIQRLFFILLLFSLSPSYAQKLILKSGHYDINELEAVQAIFDHKKSIQNQCFRIFVFEDIPDSETREQLSNLGIEILEYLPQKAFIVSVNSEIIDIDKPNLGIEKIIAFENEFKLSKTVKNRNYPPHVLKENNEVEIVVQYFPTLSRGRVENIIKNKGFEIIENLAISNSLLIRLPESKIHEIINHSAFQYIDVPAPPGEPENLPGRTEHRSNVLYQNEPSGLNYRADGFKIMMQDDGVIGPHIDFEGRTDQSNCTNCSSNPEDDHGDHVAGTIMGAGNLNPRARGMAHGSELLVFNSSNNNYSDVPSLYSNQDVYITSKSYSNGCNAGYTGLAQGLDFQTHEYPSLIHIFSAGNSGESDCGYGAGSEWGNITGGHKSGKNVIAVGNLNSGSALLNSSSRGPATDGRIKPDICAVGAQVFSTIPNNEYGVKTGTSMSCPGVSGVTAQLYDAYQDLNGGTIPKSGLIKALMLNGADDLGNPGPDFKYGWGSINARRSFKMIENENYFNNEIDQGQQVTHEIEVPNGTKKVKVMVYWTDVEGSTSAATALVNDLNISFTDPNNDEFLPWVLDPTPNPANLDADAVRGVDSLNNMEQVTITDPIPGQYTLSVEGYNIPFGPQEYFVVYEFIEDDEIIVTHPSGFESLNSGTNQIIRWDASPGEDPFTISYSEDNGNSWTVIANIQADLRHTSWNIPNTVTAEAKVKVERNGIEAISEEKFSIIGTPNSFDIEWACPDSVMLSWDPVNGAEGYEVSELGTKYMDSIDFVSDTNIVLHYPSDYESWFSVKAIGFDNEIGERAVAIKKEDGQQNCFWSAPVAKIDLDCPSAGQEYCFTLFEESENVGDNPVTYTWYIPDGTPSISNDISPQVCFNAPGDFDVALVVETPFGSDSIYVEDFINVIPATYLPYFENFENHTSFTNNPYWSISNIGGSTNFSLSSSASLSGSRSAWLNNYSQSGGSTYKLTSGPVDLSVLSEDDDVTLSFRYSYRKRSQSNFEQLKVMISEGCEENFVVRRLISGNNLSSEIYSSFWIPDDEEDWVTAHVTNITSNFYGENFQFRFEFDNDGGNNLFLDNINIYKGEPSEDLVNINEQNIGLSEIDFTVFPNPASNELNLKFNLQQDERSQIFISDVTGKIIDSHEIFGKLGENLVLIDTQGIAPGTYLITLSNNGLTETKRVIFQ